MDWSYIAGFFDGEGHISLSKGNDNAIRLTVHIVNTNKRVMLEIQKFFSGNGIDINLYSRPPRSENPNRLWILQMRNKYDIAIFLNKVLPYLIVKEDIAKLMLEYLNGVGNPNKRNTLKIIEARREFLKVNGL